jgi:hypothetical protein
MGDTKGQGWRILGTLLLAAFPMIIVSVVMQFVASSMGFSTSGVKQGTMGTIVLGFLQGMLALLSTTVTIAVASRAYQWLGNRTKEPLGA